MLFDYRLRIRKHIRSKMVVLVNIENLESYRIHKHFAKYMPDYLVSVVGEHWSHKKSKEQKKIREGKIESCFKKMAAFLHFHLIKKRTKKKSKNKNKHRENAESV
jgi:predicted nucleic acid-binding protein